MSTTKQQTQKFGFSIHEDNLHILKTMQKEHFGQVGKFKYFLFHAQDINKAEDEINYLKQKEVTGQK